jgi:hypothetical protein
MRMWHFLVILLAASAAVCHGQEQIQPAARQQFRHALTPHQFFDAKNLELQGWNIAAETYDAVTTRRDLHGRPVNELNPFGARPPLLVSSASADLACR